MFNNPSFTLREQILGTLDLFRKIMAAEACKLRLGLLPIALWSRMGRFERRFLGLYARWKAGKVPKARVRAGAPPPPRLVRSAAQSPANAGEGACGADGAGAPPPPRLVRSAAQSPVKGEGEVRRRRRTPREVAAIIGGSTGFEPERLRQDP